MKNVVNRALAAKKRITTLLLALMACITFANAGYGNGTCGAEGDGSNLTWVSSGSLLRISGIGAMNDWDAQYSVPWASVVVGVSKITIEEGVTNIGNYAFIWERFTSLSIPNSVTKIGQRSFANCDYISTITIPDGVITLDNYAFSTCNALVTINMGKNVQGIGEHAFFACRKLKNISLPNSVKTIGSWAFALCESLTSISIPDSVTSIEGYTFKDCVLLSSVSIGSNVSSIGYGAFFNCSSLSSITIPEGVKKIGSEAFMDCSSLNSVTCLATVPPTISDNILPNKNILIYVPDESFEAYITATNWKDLTNIRPISKPIRVRFVDYNKSIIADSYVASSEAATPPADPTRTGYTFIGWDKDFSNVTEDMTITAQYEINRYKVDFFDWDGALLKTDSVAYLSAAIAPETPTRTGYTFTGWDVDFAQITQDTTITALYDINYYLVVLLGHDGKLLSKQTVAYKHAAQQPEVPAREGYIFSGWSTDIESIIDSTYAIALYDKIGGTVTYLSEAGDVIASENVDLHLPAAPIIAGKSFKGWLTESADSENGIVLRATYTTDNPTTHDDVSVVPSSTTAAVNFPYITGALTYELVIRDLFGHVVCKILFNSTGHLLGIALAPGRDRSAAPAQTDGFNFTVEGLDPNTTYNYEFVAHDDTDEVIETLSGSFTTTDDTPTGVENAQSNHAQCKKELRNDHVYILRGEKVYTITGQDVK